MEGRGFISVPASLSTEHTSSSTPKALEVECQAQRFKLFSSPPQNLHLFKTETSSWKGKPIISLVDSALSHLSLRSTDTSAFIYASVHRYTALHSTVPQPAIIGVSLPIRNLRPLAQVHILARQETARRPTMQEPDMFDGTYSKFRFWWHYMEAYMEIHEPLPTERLQIMFVGSFLQDGARTWYDARKRTLKVRSEVDSWAAFSKALLERFTDRMEIWRYYDKIKNLRYEGSIQEYLSHLKDLNGLVGVSGIALWDIVLQQMTPEITRAIFHMVGPVPKSDDALIEAVRVACSAEEEILLVHGRVEGSALEGPAGAEKNPQQTKKKDFSHLTKVWECRKDAFKGIPFKETNKHKGKDCRRCGRDGHGVLNCKATKTIGGAVLPPYPGKKTAAETTAATKRKRTDELSDF